MHLSSKLSIIFLGCCASLAIAAEQENNAQPATSTQPVIPPPGEYRYEGYGSIPLENYQQIIKFKNGCGVLVEDNPKNASYFSQSTWHGACRWGLIHGNGLILYQGQGATSKFTSVRASNGRIFELLHGNAVIPRNSDQPGTYMNAPRQPDLTTLANSLTPAFSLLSAEYITSDQTLIGSALFMGRNKCYASSKSAKTMIGPEKTMSTADLAALTKYCQKNSYADYYYIYRSEDRGMRRGHAYSADYNDGFSTTRFDAKLCPAISSAAGCETIWQPMRADYEQRFAKAREEFPVLEAAKRTQWDARFVQWDEIARGKIAAFLAKEAAK